MFFPVPPKEDLPEKPSTPKVPPSPLLQGLWKSLLCVVSGVMFILVSAIIGSISGYHYLRFMVLGPPLILTGLVSLMWPGEFREGSSIITGSHARQTTLMVALAVGIVIGIYLAYDPRASLRWLGWE